MDHESPNSFFPATRWTMVRRMADGRKEVSLIGWNEFAGIYSPVLVKWLQGRGLSLPYCEDLVQGFLAKLWERENLADSLAPSKGKLRSYLLVGLKNTWRNDYEKQSARKRGGAQEAEELSGNEPSDPECETFYDREWAVATVRSACLRLRKDYEARGKLPLFDEGVKLIDHPDTECRRELQEQLGMEANALNVALKRLRERLGDRLRDEVAATLVEPDANAVNDELVHLLSALSHSGGLCEIAGSLSPSSTESVLPGNDDLRE